MLRQELIPIQFTMTLFGVRAKATGSAIFILTDEKLPWAKIILSPYLVKQFTKNEAV